MATAGADGNDVEAAPSLGGGEGEGRAAGLCKSVASALEWRRIMAPGGRPPPGRHGHRAYPEQPPVMGGWAPRDGNVPAEPTAAPAPAPALAAAGGPCQRCSIRDCALSF